MQKSRAGVRVARALHTTEHAIDGAMKSASLLIHNMIEARQDSNLAAEVGQGALSEVVSSLAELNSARQRLVASHAALSVVANQTGVTWRLEGPLEEKVRDQPAGVTLSVAA